MFKNEDYILTYLKENINKILYWIGINYKNNKLELCLYYRDEWSHLLR